MLIRDLLTIPCGKWFSPWVEQMRTTAGRSVQKNSGQPPIHIRGAGDQD
jgi:hypothetical protein